MAIKYPLRVLLIGNGGREHAIAWKLSQSPLVESIIAVPGNGGTATCPKTTNNTTVSAEDFPALLELARKNNINYVVPGPEAPLVAGAVDFFQEAGIPSFGPSKAAATMEGSKTFSKDFMKRHNIPPPPTRTLPTTTRPAPTSTAYPIMSSSRRAGWPPARASSFPRRKRRPTRRLRTSC